MLVSHTVPDFWPCIIIISRRCTAVIKKIVIDVSFPDSASESQIGAMLHRPGNKFGNEFMYPKFRSSYNFSKIYIYIKTCD